MRRRSLAILSTTAIATLALAGCGSADEPEADPGTTEAPTNLCEAAASEGDATDALEITGEFGEAPEVSFDAPLEFDDFERVVVTEGSGDELEAGQYFTFGATIVNAETGNVEATQGYEEGTALPAVADIANVLGIGMGCATPGTRVAFTVPGQTAEGGSTPGLIYVVDYYAVAQTAAWGETQDVPDGFPEVELEEGGEPIVTIPDDFDIPETTEIATRELGDGATVGLGDVVFVQYRGVKASDGEEFDSSWSRGEPTSFSTDAVIEGFTKALVGQTVGSQVIAVIPAEEAYGTELGTHDLAGEDLVFVIDILDSMSAPGA